MNAQFSLGVMYEYGQGVAQNDAKAREWMEKAAAQGHVNAQFSLGVRYYTGQGVTQNYAEAHKWWEEAATQGMRERSTTLA